MLCNKFLTLRFRCEQEEVLGFQGRNFFPVFGWGCLCMMGMETRKNNDGNAVVFMALMFLCCFLLFWMSELEWVLLDTS
jgi:hypothetical protein